MHYRSSAYSLGAVIEKSENGCGFCRYEDEVFRKTSRLFQACKVFSDALHVQQHPAVRWLTKIFQTFLPGDVGLSGHNTFCR